VRNATGYSNVMVAEHPLKLCSSYATLKVLICDVNLDHSVRHLGFLMKISMQLFQGNSNNRGLYGEPLATSYHKRFLGTVDYLWYVFKFCLCISLHMHRVTKTLFCRYTPGLECSRVLDTLPIGALRRTRGLPTRVISHLICIIVVSSDLVNNNPSINFASFGRDLFSLCILMICAKNQEIGSDHLPIVAEFAFIPVEDDSEEEDESAR
jgi:hypothetical protein